MDAVKMIVTALVAGAAAAMESTAAQAVRDAYAGLQARIRLNYPSVQVEALEEKPGSAARRAVVQEDLADAGAARDAELAQAAQRLLTAVEAHAPEAAAAYGVKLADIRGAALRLQQIEAAGSGPVTGVEVQGAEMSGDIVIENVTARQTGGGTAAGASLEPSIQAALRPLHGLLSELYPQQEDAARVAEQAGLPAGQIQASGKAVNYWRQILGEAHRRGRVAALVAIAEVEYANRADELARALAAYRRATDIEN